MKPFKAPRQKSIVRKCFVNYRYYFWSEYSKKNQILLSDPKLQCCGNGLYKISFEEFHTIALFTYLKLW